MTVLFNSFMMGMGAKFYPYKIDQSCRFNDNDSAYLTKTLGEDGDRTKWSYNVCVKRCNLDTYGALVGSYEDGSNFEIIRFSSTDNYLRWYFEQITGLNIDYKTAQVFRDVNGWYNFLFVLDTSEAVQLDRCKIYCNGLEITSWTTHTNNLTLNEAISYLFTSTVATQIGRNIDGGVVTFDGYMAESILVDGQALTPASFGVFKNGIWIPKRYTGTYGTYGFYLDFADSADLGVDVSGNGNDFTSSGLAADDQVLDSPTNNYATLSSALLGGGQVSDGNLGFDTETTLQVVLSTQAVNTGKLYWEIIPSSLGGSGGLLVGINDEWVDDYGQSGYSQTKSVHYYSDSGLIFIDNDGGSAYGDAFIVDDVIGIALNLDSEQNTITFYNEGVSQGAINIDSGYTWYPTLTDASSTSRSLGIINFGQLGFVHTPPTGYKALCSNNLPTPTIKNSSTGFDVVTYEGDATDARKIEGIGFQSDLIWIKNRTRYERHILQDSVRGFTLNKKISSDNVDVQNSGGLDDQYGYISSVDSTGFTLDKDGTGAWDYIQTNYNTDLFVAWCFRMGVKYGFDIQTYEGTGVAHAESHNLGDVPELMIVKNLTVGRSWIVYHHHALNKTDPETDYGVLDEASSWNDVNTIWNDTAPTPTQFTIGTHAAVNENGEDFVAYLWRSISGFSKVFSYKGNGNDNGPFVYCGFRPRYVLIKRLGIGGWVLFDTSRDTYNVVVKSIYANTSGVELDGTFNLDILSSGFKLRTTDGYVNGSEGYVGIAYAEQPGKWSNAR